MMHKLSKFPDNPILSLQVIVVFKGKNTFQFKVWREVLLTQMTLNAAVQTPMMSNAPVARRGGENPP